MFFWRDVWMVKLFCLLQIKRKVLKFKSEIGYDKGLDTDIQEVLQNSVMEKINILFLPLDPMSAYCDVLRKTLALRLHPDINFQIDRQEAKSISLDYIASRQDYGFDRIYILITKEFELWVKQLSIYFNQQGSALGWINGHEWKYTFSASAPMVRLGKS